MHKWKVGDVFIDLEHLDLGKGTITAIWSHSGYFDCEWENYGSGDRHINDKGLVPIEILNTTLYKVLNEN